MLRLIGLAVLALLPATALHAAAGLSPEERRIAEWVDAHREAAIDLLAKTVDINSGTMNAAGVRAVGDAMAPEFTALGFEVRWESLPPELERAGHFHAERRGERGQRVLMIGHLDTVFEPDHPNQRFVRDGDTARGPGAADMKGGNVAVLFALKALASVGALDDTTITVIYTGDEERPGRPLDVSRKSLIEAARRSDVALGFESSVRDGAQHFAVIARRSASNWRLEVGGVQGHSSRIFSDEYGSGAIFEAARILAAFHQELRGERYLTFNAGVILGGTDVTYDGAASRGTAFGKTNVVPQTALVRGGIRTLTNEQLEAARVRMREIVGASHPRTSATIVFDDGYPAMPPTDGNRALLDTLNGINRDLGAPEQAAYDPGLRGAADISFAAPHVDAALAGLGAFGRGAHSPDETVELDLLPLVIKRTALLVYRLTR
jgi:glutamate carboxypeptidase